MPHSSKDGSAKDGAATERIPAKQPGGLTRTVPGRSDADAVTDSASAKTLPLDDSSAPREGDSARAKSPPSDADVASARTLPSDADSGSAKTLPSDADSAGAATLPRDDGSTAAPPPGVRGQRRSARYKVLNEHARGGMGRILAARDQELERPIALKELLPEAASAEARFLREAKITARLQHPGIVPVHEAGRWEDGRPYYAMKLVSGRSLRELMEEAQSLSERLALLPNLMAVAEAIGYAHREGIIHRDLTPSNFVVGDHGETVVIDWGLAKELAADGPPRDDLGPFRTNARADLTHAGSVLGTPAYMAPEQARGEELDERADVYALGAVLYHLLAGSPPYKGDSADEVLETVKKTTPRPLETIQPDVPADLVAIVRKAMARERKDRYATAKHLAEDLRRFQTGKLVAAHSYTPRELLFRWLRRYRAVVGVGAAALVVLAVVGAVSVQRIIEERDEANRQRERTQAAQKKAVSAKQEAVTERNNLVLTQARASVETDPTAALAWLKKYPLSAESWDEAPRIAAQAVSEGVATHLARLGHAIPSVVPSEDGERIAVAYFGGSDTWGLAIWKPEAGTVRLVSDAIAQKSEEAFALDSEGGRLAYANAGGRVMIQDLETDEKDLVEEVETPIRWLDFSADGALLVGGGYDGVVRVWGRGDEPIVLRGHEGPVRTVEFALGHRRLVSCADDNRLLLWDLDSESSSALGSCYYSENPGLAVSGDGTTVAFGQTDDTVKAVDLETEEVVRMPGTGSAVTMVAVSEGGDWIVSGDAKGNLAVWESGAGASRWQTRVEGRITGLDLSSDGSLVAAATDEGMVHLHDWRREAHFELRGHESYVTDVDVLPDGRLLSADAEGTVRLWRIPPDRPTRLLEDHKVSAFHPVWLGGGSALAAEGADSTVRVWELQNGSSRTLRGHENAAYGLARAPDGSTLASASWDGTARIWDPATGESQVLRGHEGKVRDVAWSPNGKRVATCGEDGTVRLWDRKTGSDRIVGRHEGEVFRIAFSPDGRRLASAATDSLGVWALRRDDHKILEQGEGVARVAFSPDGDLLASGGWDGRVLLWDTETWTRRTVYEHSGEVHDVGFSPDGRYLASSSKGNTAHYLDLTEDRGRVLRGESGVRAVAFSPDGELLATGAKDGTLRVLELASGRRWFLPTQETRIAGLSFSPDGERLATASSTSAVRVWPARTSTPIEGEPETLRAQVDELTSVEVDANGRLIGLGEAGRP